MLVPSFSGARDRNRVLRFEDEDEHEHEFEFEFDWVSNSATSKLVPRFPLESRTLAAGDRLVQSTGGDIIQRVTNRFRIDRYFAMVSIAAKNDDATRFTLADQVVETLTLLRKVVPFFEGMLIA